MSVKANPFKVGVFVLAGLALGVAALLVFGSGRLFARNVPFVLNFEYSVHGLTIGAPVKFRGVVIGRVKAIHLALDADTESTHVPVIIEVDRELIRNASGSEVDFSNPAFLNRQVDNGLRASLETESLITGRLYVGLDYYPDAGKPVFRDREKRYQEIPTISTGLSEFIKSLERVDIPKLTEKLTTVVDQLSTTLDELQIKALSDQARQTLAQADSLLRSPEITNAFASVRETSEEARALLEEMRSEVKPAVGSLTNTAEHATVALADLQQTLSEVRQLVRSDSPVLAELNEALAEFADAARAVRLLSEQLKRNPNSVLFGTKPRADESSR